MLRGTDDQSLTKHVEFMFCPKKKYSGLYHEPGGGVYAD